MKQGWIHSCPSRVRVSRNSAGEGQKARKTPKKVKRGPIDRPTDQQTNIAGCRVA